VRRAAIHCGVWSADVDCSLRRRPARGTEGVRRRHGGFDRRRAARTPTAGGRRGLRPPEGGEDLDRRRAARTSTAGGRRGLRPSVRCVVQEAASGASGAACRRRRRRRPVRRAGGGVGGVRCGLQEAASAASGVSCRRRLRGGSCGLWRPLAARARCEGVFFGFFFLFRSSIALSEALVRRCCPSLVF
jgi:hypothetical protein